MAGAFKPRKEEVKLQPIPLSEGQRTGQTFIQDLLKKQFQPFTGKRVAGLSDIEKVGQEALTTFAGRTPSKLTQLGTSELEKTLTGEFDPEKSKFFAPVRRALGAGAARAQRGIRRAAQLGGTLFGTPRIKKEADILTDLESELGGIMAGLTEAERARRVSLIPTALGVGRAEEAQPLETAQAIASLGTVPRGIEQARLDAALQEFLRKQQFPQQQSELARLLMGMQQQMVPAETFGPSQFAQFGPVVSDILATFLKGSPA